MIRDDSMVYNSMPPQYIYECPKCGERECDTVMYDSPEMKEQKPAEWSGEDRRTIDRACVALRAYANGELPDILPSEILEYADKLQSLRRRLSDEEIKKIRSEEYTKGFNDAAFGGKLKEWSEEDEDVLQNIIQEIEWERRNTTVDKDIRNYDRQLNFLKSLRPQYHGDVTMTEAYKMGKEAGEASHWKPSEEQMKA